MYWTFSINHYLSLIKCAVKMNSVLCLSWVKRGAAKKDPEQIKLTDEDLASLVSGVEAASLSDPSEDLPRKRKVPQSIGELFVACIKHIRSLN